MGSMNWLGFSLSPQEAPNSNQDHHHHYHSGDISGAGAGECFDLSSDTSANHLPPPFGILEAFHRSTSHNQSHQDHWSMKGSSEISMLMGNQEADQPKLENFLGSSHSFRENHHHQNNNNNNNNNGDYMFNNMTTTTTTHDNISNPRASATSNNSTTTTTTTSTAANNNNNGLNVSMIKTWLRSNQPEIVTDTGGGGGGGASGALSLSMGTGDGSHSSGSALPLLASGGGVERESSLSENSTSKQLSDNVSNSSPGQQQQVDAQNGVVETVPRKSIDTFGQRTSIYRGVTRHRWTGRYEAHLWDNSCRREGQTRKGRQVYLGGYDKEEKAARAYDLAALKYWGTTTTTNFPVSDYEKEVEDMKHMTRQEYVASLRRKSSGFSRGASIYRGVTRHHQHGRWQARIGRVAGNKDLYLGTFSTQEEAAEAYDIAAIKFRGLNAVTNFEINRYDVKAILESTTLPIGGAAKRLKDVEDLTTPDTRQIIRAAAAVAAVTTDHENSTSQLTHDHGISNFHSWPGIAFPQAQPLSMYHPYSGGHQQQRMWCKQEQDTEGSISNNYQDLHHQLQLNSGNTHNFFQMHNLMGLENSSSLEQSSGSDSVVYGNGTGGYGLPFGSTIVAHDGNGNANGTENGNGYENYYYYNQANGSLRGAVGTYDQGSACNNWVPTAIPALVPRSTSVAAVGGHGGGGGGGAPTFTVWNDT